MKVAVYSTKNYNHKYLSQVNEAFGFEMEYFDFLLTPRTAKTAEGYKAIFLFVNDDGGQDRGSRAVGSVGDHHPGVAPALIMSISRPRER